MLEPGLPACLEPFSGSREPKQACSLCRRLSEANRWPSTRHPELLVRLTNCTFPLLPSCHTLHPATILCQRSISSRYILTLSLGSEALQHLFRILWTPTPTSDLPDLPCFLLRPRLTNPVPFFQPIGHVSTAAMSETRFRQIDQQWQSAPRRPGTGTGEFRQATSLIDDGSRPLP